MSQIELPSLADFNHLKDYLEAERKTFLQVHEMDEESELIRSLADAETILSFIEDIQIALHKFFTNYPTLIPYFNEDYMSLKVFFERKTILERCFQDGFIFPEKELIPFAYDGEIQNDLISQGIAEIEAWITGRKDAHEITQKDLKENFDISISPKDLACRCANCSSAYKTKLREEVYELCKTEMDETARYLQENIEQGIKFASDSYYNLHKYIEKSIYNVRYRLKRSTLSKLEKQLKSELNDTFGYPSELAKSFTDGLKPYFEKLLLRQGVRRDLVGPGEYERFYSQLGTRIWRGEKYLEREFKKLVQSVLLLKRKDISAKILKEYLGEFWTHSQARSIKRKIIYHAGPTNSGKTYHAIQELCKAEKGCYLAPLRLLASELYDTMNEKGVKTNLLTGEEVIEINGATHYSSTIEMARFQEIFDCAVIDEIQMMTDPQRGWAWTRALVNIFAPEIHLCGDASVLELVQQIIELTGDELEVRYYNRMTELKVMDQKLPLTSLDKGDALIVFSRRNALKYKASLEQLDFKVSIVYGRLSPEVRREQARKFDEGETDIMVSTDAIAMGMNLPIQRIIFSTLTKHINSKAYPISNSEIKQIAGRAGRFQRFPTGYASCLSRVEDGLEKVHEALNAELPQRPIAMVGPDLEIFNQVNNALITNALPKLKLSEFLRLFNTMTFKKPFYCVDLKEMIELTEMVEEADQNESLTSAEVFGFACAPVNQGLMEHVQYYVWILNLYVNAQAIRNEEIDFNSDDIEYLETSIKCVELFQWLARHFNNKNFDFDDMALLHNKGKAIEKLNTLLSEKIVRTCSSCGKKLEESSSFNICEECFQGRKFARRRGPGHSRGGESRGQSGRGGRGGSGGGSRGRKKSGGSRRGGSKSTGAKKKFGRNTTTHPPSKKTTKKSKKARR